MYPYEGMFLLDSNAFAEDGKALEKKLRGLLEKHGAEITQLEQWDERRLAYEIKGHKRGVYLLGYLCMPGENIDELRGDLALQEWYIRGLFVRLDRDIPAFLEANAKYYDRVREDAAERRPRREDEPAPVPATKDAPQAEVSDAP